MGTPSSLTSLTSLEICAGGGGQAIGLERAGFHHAALVDNDRSACDTLRLNRPAWHVVRCDVRDFEASEYRGVDLFAGGVPCPPFSKAGHGLGPDDERDLFPHAIRMVRECLPKAVMLENVRGLLEKRFSAYREEISAELRSIGYEPDWRLIHAAAFGVPQLRPRVVMVAFRKDVPAAFRWPDPDPNPAKTAGEALYDLMAAGGWPGAEAWRARANRIAPTIVGGSKKHGGPDLGPTRARNQWREMNVNGATLADLPPNADFSPDALPALTLRMVARLQGFPDDWKFAGLKTGAYRQIGNAFPPPVAFAVGRQIASALLALPARPEPAWDIKPNHVDTPLFGRPETLSRASSAFGSANQ